MIIVGLGANLPSFVGQPLATLRAAIADLPNYGIRCIQQSLFYQSPAWPNPNDPVFINCAIIIETALTPHDCLQVLHAVEQKFGRVRGTTNAPRTLDLDIIAWGNQIMDYPALPHPRLHERAFVLRPIMDMAPHWQHPVLHCDAARLYAGLKDPQISEL